MDIEIVEAHKKTYANNAIVWEIMVNRTHPDGSTDVWAHIFPDNVFEWRAAEYGIDHRDKEKLLEIVFFEHLAGISADHPHHLYQAKTIDYARNHLLDEIAAIKGAINGSEKIEMTIDPDRVAVMAGHVARQRAAVRTEPPLVRRQTAEELRIALA